MLVRIDPASDAALFDQVAASIRTDLVAGRLKPGERLPSARDIAASLGINLHTVLRAYQILRDEGLVDMRRGRGAVVTESATALTSLATDIRELVARAREAGLGADALASLVRDAAQRPDA